MYHINNKERGSSVAIALIVLAVAAIGILALLSYRMSEGQTVKVAETDASSEEATAASEEAAPQVKIKPGNPVVAKVNGKDIMRADVVNYIQTLPIQAQQLPIDQLFPAAQNQLINEKLVRAKSQKAKLDNNPIVKERLAAAKEEIVTTVFMQEAIQEKIDEEQLKQAYLQMVEKMPKVNEARASHILVDTKKEASQLIVELEAGADFAELAKEHSTDTGSAARGGDIGYFTKEDVVAEFGEAAFKAEVGKVSFEPVKSEFGYHVIKVEEIRKRPPPTFEEARQTLENQARQAIMQSLFASWRKDADIELFDINGETPAAPKASAEPAAGAE